MQELYPGRLIEQQFDEHLIKDEKILWVGQPDPSVLFTRSDIFLVPFSLLWGGFAIFWEAEVLGTTGQTKGTPADEIFILLFGLVFVLIGLYFIFGRFVAKRAKKRKTFYAVTNRRVLVLTKLRGSHLQAAFIDAIPSINASIRADGSGTVQFGNASLMVSIYANTGMDFFGTYYGAEVPTFHDIRDARHVHEMVSEMRRQG